MTQAPNRGARKCETCLHFTDKRNEWRGTPNLKWDDPAYRSPKYIEGDGLCEWKCPPVMKRILWGEWGERLVKADDWCHCWETQHPISILATQTLLCGGQAALPPQDGKAT